MGIFRWIMSLLRRKKIAKHEYAPEKAIALKKDETICGQNLRLSQQVPCKNDKSEISEQACIYPDSQIVLRETQQQKRRRRRQQIQSDTPPVNEQLFAAQNTQDSFSRFFNFRQERTTISRLYIENTQSNGGEFHVSCTHNCFQSNSPAWPSQPVHALSSSSVGMLLIGYANHHGVMLAICHGTSYCERGTDAVCPIKSPTVFL